MTEQRQRVEDLKPGTAVDSIFLLSSADQRAKKNGESFFTLTLGDATGTIGAIMWDGFDCLLSGETKKNDFINVRGNVSLYKDALQLVVRDIWTVDAKKVNCADFLPHTSRNIDEMMEELNGFISGVKSKPMQQLLGVIFSDEEVIDGFRNAPSALRMHQAYIGGLLEHTLGVVKNCVAIGKNYPECDMDSLVVGALLHDMGKIYEFGWAPSIHRTDIGQLVGHISIGVSMLEKYCARIKNFSDNLKTVLTHLVISHHGVLEFGSPKRPKTLEAIVLHYADNIDAKCDTFIQEAQKARDKGARWTEYLRMFERSIFTGYDDMSSDEPRQSDETDAPSGSRKDTSAQIDLLS